MNCVFVTNIPTPYRVSMWNQLVNYSKSAEKGFKVLFMNEFEPDRDWIIDEKLQFPHKIWNMRIFKLRNYYLRFSMSYVLSAINGGDHLILGCSWNDLNILLISILKRMGIVKSRISFWTEANHLTGGARKQGVLKFLLRRFVLNSADGFYFIPGEMSLITLKKWGVNCTDRCIMLPNLPHKSFDDNFATWKGGNSGKPVFTIVARLKEDIKGLKNFMELIGVERLRCIDINIIGSGEDRNLYEDFIFKNNLSNNIKLLGSLSVEAVVDKLKMSDIFLIPSFSDASPLVLVEACKIGLPLLVSNRCGNHYECLVEGENGYLFDPYEKTSVQEAFDKLLSKRSEWSKFSRKSINISTEKFNTEEVLSRLSVSM